MSSDSLLNIVSLSAGKEGGKDGGIIKRFLLTRLQLSPRSPVAVWTHTLLQQDAFQCMLVCAECWYFLWTRHKENISTVSGLQEFLFYSLCCPNGDWVQTERWQLVSFRISHTDDSSAFRTQKWKHATGTSRSTDGSDDDGVQWKSQLQ